MKQLEEKCKALKQGKEQFYYNLATVLQYIDLMRREELKQWKEQCYNNLADVNVKQMEERNKALKQGKEQFYDNSATVLLGIDLKRRETNGRKN